MKDVGKKSNNTKKKGCRLKEGGGRGRRRMTVEKK